MVLIVSNLLGGVGVASSVAVGGLLVEHLGATSLAGVGQACSVGGAALAAIPLAGLASTRGRRMALALGYGVAVAGALVIIAAAVVQSLVLMLLGLGMFGVAQAVNLQSRYAAADQATPETRGRTMSVVIWATTIGSVAGPNLSAAGDTFGRRLGLPALVGPYVFSVTVFVLAALVIALLFDPPRVHANGRDPVARGATGRALGWAMRHPAARFAVVLTASAHAVMVMVMVMTPLHMAHHGQSLGAVGVVISGHILGMYALSPLFGWLADVWGAIRTATLGLGLLLLATALGLVAASGTGGQLLTGAALVVLGVGWSASIISASSLLTTVTPPEVKIPLQGATDAAMNVAGALAAVLAGPLLALGGFHTVNVAGAVITVPALVLLAMGWRDRARQTEARLTEPARQA